MRRLEQVSAAVPPLRAKVRACRRMISGLEEAIREMNDRRIALGSASDEDRATLTVLQTTTATHVDIAVSNTTAVGGDAGGFAGDLAAAAAARNSRRVKTAMMTTQRMTIADARRTLQTRLEAAERERAELERRMSSAETRIVNLRDTMKELLDELKASTGALAASVLGNRAVRAVGFYQWNMLADNAMGRGRVWGQRNEANDIEVLCPSCGTPAVMGGGRGRNAIEDDDDEGGGGGGGGKAAVRRRRWAKSDDKSKSGPGASSGADRKRNNKAKAKGRKRGGGGAGDADDAGGGDLTQAPTEEPWESTALARFVSAKGRALRKGVSAAVGASLVAMQQTTGAAPAGAAAAAGGGDTFDMLTGGGASAVGLGALANEGKHVYDDEEDDEAQEREGPEPGSLICEKVRSRSNLCSVDAFRFHLTRLGNDSASL